MEIKYSLHLQCDERSVAVVRRFLGAMLAEAGVSLRCIEQLVLATSEACANVIEHAQPDVPNYDVHFSMDHQRCHIQVVDGGVGFDEPTYEYIDLEAERGRGIQLMRAMMDEVRFEAGDGRGTIVHLIKTLDLDTDSALRELLESAQHEHMTFVS